MSVKSDNWRTNYRQSDPPFCGGKRLRQKWERAQTEMWESAAKFGRRLLRPDRLNNILHTIFRLPYAIFSLFQGTSWRSRSCARGGCRRSSTGCSSASPSPTTSSSSAVSSARIDIHHECETKEDGKLQAVIAKFRDPPLRWNRRRESKLCFHLSFHSLFQHLWKGRQIPYDTNWNVNSAGLFSTSLHLH